MLRSKTHWFDYFLIIQVTLNAQAGGTELNEAMNNCPVMDQESHKLPAPAFLQTSPTSASKNLCGRRGECMSHLIPEGLFFLVLPCLIHHPLSPLHLIYKDSKLLVNDVLSKWNQLKYIVYSKPYSFNIPRSRFSVSFFSPTRHKKLIKLGRFWRQAFD